MSTRTSLAPLLSVVFLLILTAFTNCSQPTDSRAEFDLAKAEREIEQRLRDYENAMASGDAEAFASLYAEDAEIFHHNRPSTIGRENVKGTFEGWMRDSVTEAKFQTTGLWGNEDALVEQGTGYFAHMTGKWKVTGKYMLVWRKIDGEWQIFRDTWFSDPPQED